VAVWLAYGIVLEEAPMMIANSLSLVLACAVLAMKLKYGGKDRQRPDDASRMAKA
jgi:MtN3 and saliva related transmembrane protein